jgi:hypothetical protein
MSMKAPEKDIRKPNCLHHRPLLHHIHTTRPLLHNCPLNYLFYLSSTSKNDFYSAAECPIRGTHCSWCARLRQSDELASFQESLRYQRVVCLWLCSVSTYRITYRGLVSRSTLQRLRTYLSYCWHHRDHLAIRCIPAIGEFQLLNHVPRHCCCADMGSTRN